MNQRETISWRRSEAGFSVIQLVIIVAVVVITSTFALFGIQSARASMRLSGSARELAGYLERALCFFTFTLLPSKNSRPGDLSDAGALLSSRRAQRAALQREGTILKLIVNV